jgi:hypothetical protein
VRRTEYAADKCALEKKFSESDRSSGLYDRSQLDSCSINSLWKVQRLSSRERNRPQADSGRRRQLYFSNTTYHHNATRGRALKGLAPDAPTFHLADGRGLCKAAQFIFPYLKDKSAWKWPKDVEHFNALPVRSPGLLFSGIACHEQTYIDLWKTLNPDPTDKEIVRNYPIRQPLFWI